MAVALQVLLEKEIIHKITFKFGPMKENWG